MRRLLSCARARIADTDAGLSAPADGEAKSSFIQNVAVLEFSNVVASDIVYVRAIELAYQVSIHIKYPLRNRAADSLSVGKNKFHNLDPMLSFQ